MFFINAKKQKDAATIPHTEKTSNQKMNYTFKNKDYSIKRYPVSKNNSLKPWGASDELCVNYISEHNVKKIAIANDSFGFLSVCLNGYLPCIIVNNKTQELSIKNNLEQNKIPQQNVHFSYPLKALEKNIDIGILKIPKALDLFELYLQQLHQNLSVEGTIVCGFMTKYFTPQLLKIAEKYFNHIEQSKAVKKARLLILKQKKAIEPVQLLHTIDYKNQKIKQYYGVFSANHIDYATQFLIEHFALDATEKTVLDLASGNGILAKTVLEQNPTAEVHLLDDSYLAIASSKLNLSEYNCHYHHAYNLDQFEDNFFNLVISNPPFHFEYETNISVPLGMFTQVARCLKPTGRFIMVANRHLSYKKHLQNRFSSVEIIAENAKFVVYECFEPFR